MGEIFIMVTICCPFITLRRAIRAWKHLLLDSFLGVLAKIAGGKVDYLGLLGVWSPPYFVFPL